MKGAQSPGENAKADLRTIRRLPGTHGGLATAHHGLDGLIERIVAALARGQYLGRNLDAGRQHNRFGGTVKVDVEFPVAEPAHRRWRRTTIWLLRENRCSEAAERTRARTAA